MIDPKAALEIRRFVVEELKWETLNVFTLVLKPAEGAAMFSFNPGQWVYLHLLKEDGTSAGRAAFSVASAPERSQEKIELSVKVYGSFTKAASQLIPDDVVGIQGPFGVFALKDGDAPIVMFAGGIGITPIRSMTQSLHARNTTMPITLFYSNKTVEEAAYFEEFGDLEKAWPNFKPVFLLTGETPRVWEGETGRVNEQMIKKYVPDLQACEYYMCGPVGMMDAISQILIANGVDVKARLHKESFG